MSRYWGGTLIAEEVVDLEEHQRRLADPDRYRPVPCRRCGGKHVHVHMRTARKPKGDPTLPPVIEILQFLCAQCWATWRVLPRFMARHLWHPWQVVEKNTLESEPPVEGKKAERGLPIAAGTRARWRARLGSSGRRLVVVLAASGAAVLEQVAQRVGLEGSRRQLVEGFAAQVVATAGGRLSALGALLHRLERGVRLM